jgi:hypothetical protein
MLDTIIQKRSKGNATIAMTTKAKLILKGFNPDSFGHGSPDDSDIISKVRQVAAELGVTLV